MEKGVAVLPLQFFALLRAPSRKKGSCSCRSPWPSVSSVEKGVAVAVLRGSSRPFVEKRKFCSCRSPWPSVSSVEKGVEVEVLQLQFFVALRGPSRPFVDKKKLQLPFFALLRAPSRKKGSSAVAVLRGPPCPPWKKVLKLKFCSCRSPCPPWIKQLPLQFFAFLHTPPPPAEMDLDVALCQSIIPAKQTLIWRAHAHF